MHSPILKDLEKLTDALLQAADTEDASAYGKHYAALLQLCFDHQDEKSNHPLQWEILADFTEDTEEAIIYYKKALSFADEIQDFALLTGSQLSLAGLYAETDNKEAAIAATDIAVEYAERSQDQTLIRQAHDALASLR
ncbi:MAG: hypothetical protein HRU20_20965 [Pseudomonadales bacterium]|nr:hypothetical protein [Pseudomonadales bacterium]